MTMFEQSSNRDWQKQQQFVSCKWGAYNQVLTLHENARYLSWHWSLCTNSLILINLNLVSVIDKTGQRAENHLLKQPKESFKFYSFLLTWCRGRPTMDGNTARGASSPAKPALHIPEPLSTTRAWTSSSAISNYDRLFSKSSARKVEIHEAPDPTEYSPSVCRVLL